MKGLGPDGYKITKFLRFRSFQNFLSQAEKAKKSYNFNFWAKARINRAKMPKDKPLDNNSVFRAVSNGLDKVLGTTYDNHKESIIRGTVHAAYHQAQGFINDNPREYERAKDQWNTAWGGATDNLKKYDASKK